jgi:hypothetical protein
MTARQVHVGGDDGANSGGGCSGAYNDEDNDNEKYYLLGYHAV